MHLCVHTRKKRHFGDTGYFPRQWVKATLFHVLFWKTLGEWHFGGGGGTLEKGTVDLTYIDAGSCWMTKQRGDTSVDSNFTWQERADGNWKSHQSLEVESIDSPLFYSFEDRLHNTKEGLWVWPTSGSIAFITFLIQSWSLEVRKYTEAQMA